MLGWCPWAYNTTRGLLPCLFVFIIYSICSFSSVRNPSPIKVDSNKHRFGGKSGKSEALSGKICLREVPRVIRQTLRTFPTYSGFPPVKSDSVRSRLHWRNPKVCWDCNVLNYTALNVTLLKQILFSFFLCIKSITQKGTSGAKLSAFYWPDLATIKKTKVSTAVFPWSVGEKGLFWKC